jgi:hypothetical protein
MSTMGLQRRARTACVVIAVVGHAAVVRLNASTTDNRSLLMTTTVSQPPELAGCVVLQTARRW